MRLIHSILVLFLFVPGTVSATNQSELKTNTEHDYELFIDLAIKGDSIKMDSLIQLGINADSALYDGITPLMFAAQEGNLNVVKLLVANGANVNAVPKNKITPLMGALYSNHSKVAKLLFTEGAAINVQDKDGMSPFLLAVQNNDSVLYNLFFDAGAEIMHKNKDEVSSLHLAAINNNTEIAEILLFNGFDIDAKDKFGFTALMIAEEFDQREIAYYLISNEANVNIANKEGETALSFSIMNGNSYFTELLLMNGANPNPQIKSAKDFYYYAKLSGNKDIKYLLKKYNSERNRKPVIDKPYLAVPNLFMNQNWWTGLTFGLHESKYNYSLEVSFITNPTLKRSLITIDDVTYSFWTREMRIQSRFEKYLALSYSNSKSIGLSIGAAPAYTIGTFRATHYKPVEYFSISPSVGTYYRSNNFEMKLAYEYLIRSTNNYSGLLLTLSYIL